MAHHIIVEFNMDKAHLFENSPQFPTALFRALSHLYRKFDNENILRGYGIRVLNEHHSSDCSKIKIHIEE